MSGLVATLTANAQMSSDGKAVVAAVDFGIDQITKMLPPLGTVVSVAEGIISLIDPAAAATGPTLTDLQNQISAFQNDVEQQLAAVQARIAGGQLKDNATQLELVLTGPNGSLSVLGELADFVKSPGLPLADVGQAQNYQIYARAAVLTLLGGGPSGTPATSRPTSYWWLPAGDLPLFQPANPWTYAGTTKAFDKADWLDLGDGIVNDMNPYTGSGQPLPAFDTSMMTFTNSFGPTSVEGVPPNCAFNPTWVLQQSMAAVYYYLVICGAVLASFPNDGATIPDFVGGNNFAGNLLWYHDQIRAGIVNIAPPAPGDLLPVAPDQTIPASANGGVSSWSVPCGTTTPNGFDYFTLSRNGGSSAPASDYSRPYGALCSYTGFVAGYGQAQPSVASYPDYAFPGAGGPAFPPPPVAQVSLPALPAHASASWYTAFYAKYLIASLWRAKLVYLGIGLRGVWTTVGQLDQMCGQPAPAGPCFGDWSLREVFKLLGSADQATFPLAQVNVAYAGETKLSVSSLLGLLQRGSTSLRATLQV
ncbi:MAG TPA: hypothetical protein VGF94_15225 [Kofleriaceae bacterium]|jgi:hypothetical protein